MSTVSSKSWDRYISALRKLNNRASNNMLTKINNSDLDNPDDMAELIRYAYGTATRYGEGAAALAAEMYDALAELSGAIVAPAIPAATATYGEVAKAIYGTKLQSNDPEVMAGSIGRLVKMAGADTMQQNALRDEAEWAWIPHGDTCAFCLMLASNGWQPASKKAIKNGHATHIHANCDCTYAIRFNHDMEIEGYDPEHYRDLYNSAEGASWKDKVSFMRREQRAENPEKYREQNRNNYIGSKIRKLFNTLPTESVVEKLRQEYDPWVDSLSKKEVHAITKYTKNELGDVGEAFYIKLNKMLRGEGPADPKLQDYADTISKALKKNPLKTKVAAYRGLDTDAFANLKVGDKFPGKQFTSTSVIPSKAFNGDYKIVIIAPPGTNCAYLDRISGFPNQRELLFDKDCVFRVLYNHNRLTILEVIV